VRKPPYRHCCAPRLRVFLMDRRNKRYFALAAPRRTSAGVLQRAPLAAPLSWGVPAWPAPHGSPFGGAPAPGRERCSVPRAWPHDAARGSGGPPGGVGRQPLGKVAGEMLGVSWGHGLQTGLPPPEGLFAQHMLLHTSATRPSSLTPRAPAWAEATQSNVA
jgi:hypothetical protein